MRSAGRRRRGRCGSDARSRKRRCHFKQTACPRSNLATCSDDCSCGGGADRPISLPVTQLKNGRPVPKPTENLAHRLVNLIHRFPIPKARPPAGPPEHDASARVGSNNDTIVCLSPQNPIGLSMCQTKTTPPPPGGHRMPSTLAPAPQVAACPTTPPPASMSLGT